MQGDWRTAELIELQRGACTRRQLLALGLSRSAIDRRLRSGLLRPVAPGVYVAAGRVDDREARAAAALLAMPHAALSHWTAAQHHGFALPPVPEVHVIVHHGSSRRGHVLGHLPLVLHRTRSLSEADRCEVDGWRVTSAARTICDLAGWVRPARLRHLVESALVAGQVASAELVACHQALARRGRRGTVVVRGVLAHLVDDDQFPESRLELALDRLLCDGGIEGFRRQLRPPWFDGRRGIVDFAHAERRLVLEADGRRWHATTQAFEDDRRRDRLAVLHGWRVLRFGWREVVHRPDEVRSEIRSALAVVPVAELGIPARR